MNLNLSQRNSFDDAARLGDFLCHVETFLSHNFSEQAEALSLSQALHICDIERFSDPTLQEDLKQEERLAHAARKKMLELSRANEEQLDAFRARLLAER